MAVRDHLAQGIACGAEAVIHGDHRDPGIAGLPHTGKRLLRKHRVKKDHSYAVLLRIGKAFLKELRIFVIIFDFHAVSAAVQPFRQDLRLFLREQVVRRQEHQDLALLAHALGRDLLCFRVLRRPGRFTGGRLRTALPSGFHRGDHRIFGGSASAGGQKKGRGAHSAQQAVPFSQNGSLLV